jgi:hypothetical protein
MLLYAKSNLGLTSFERSLYGSYGLRWDLTLRLAREQRGLGDLSAHDLYTVVLATCELLPRRALYIWQRSPRAFLDRAVRAGNDCLRFYADVIDRQPPEETRLLRRWVSNLAGALHRSDLEQRMALAWEATLPWALQA